MACLKTKLTAETGQCGVYFRWRRLQGEELNFYLVLFMGGAFEEITRAVHQQALNDIFPNAHFPQLRENDFFNIKKSVGVDRCPFFRRPCD